MQNPPNESRPQTRGHVRSADAHPSNSQLPFRLNRQEAARYLTEAGLPIAATTLAKKAVNGSGPPFRIGNGRALYDADDLLAWAEVQLGPKLRSTAERRTMGRA
jgi:hypothetical protein